MRRHTHNKKLNSITAVIICILLTSCIGSNSKITANGTIEADEYDIFSQVSGKIIEIRKQEGDIVAEGEVLALVDSSDATILLKQAEGNLKLAQAKLSELTVGTPSEVLDQARAALKAAQAHLDDVTTGASADEIRQADAMVDEAKARLDGIKAGNRPEQLEQAEALVREAQARLDDLKAGSRPEQLEQARTTVDEAQSALDNAVTNYEHYKTNFNNLEALSNVGAASKQQLLDAQNLLDGAKYRLEVANGHLESARAQLALLENGATEKAIEAAQAQYEQAFANAEYIRNGASQDVIAAAQAQYEQASANAARVRNGASEDTIKAAQAVVEQNRAALEHLLKGATAEQLEQADANVLIAAANVENALNQLAKYEIKSPISGVLLYKNVHIGQLANPGSVMFTVQATENRWIKIYLPQKYNGKVSIGDSASVTVANFESQSIQGIVAWISPKAEFTPKNVETMEAKQESTVFAVKVKIDESSEFLRPGMNASVALGGTDGARN